MNEKFNKNAKIKKLTTMLGRAVRLIVIDPLHYNAWWKQDLMCKKLLQQHGLQMIPPNVVFFNTLLNNISTGLSAVIRQKSRVLANFSISVNNKILT